ncbi:MAG: GAF domain-containing protein [Anaerolineae bacterium]
MTDKNPIRLLVVDDDWRFCRAIEEAVGDSTDGRYEVKSATTVAEANLVVSSTRWPFDLFLIDQRLEDREIDGIELTTRLLKASPSSGAIVLTGFASVEDGLRALQAGADDYIPKTRNWDTLFKELTLRIKVLIENREIRRRRIQELESLNKILEETIGYGAEADLEVVLNSVAEQTNRALPGVDAICLYYIDRETQTPRLGGVTGVWDQTPAATIGSGESVVSRALQLDAPYYAPDSAADAFVGGTFVTREKVCSTVVFPLLYGNERVGCMFFNYRTPQTFPEHETRELTLFARQAALAIHKAVLYDETRRRQQRFETVARIMPVIGATLDPQEVVRAILTEVLKVVRGARQACMLHYEPETGDLVFSPVSFEFFRMDVPGQQGRTRLSAGENSVAMRVARTGHAENVPNVNANPDYLHVVSTTHSELCVPIKIGSEMLGVLALESDRGQAFTDEDQRLLEALADQIAIALKKAQEHTEFVKIQDELAADSAIAWMGLLGSNWSHTVVQRTLEIDAKVYRLRDSLAPLRVSPQVLTWLDEIEEASAQIKNLPIAGRRSAAPRRGAATLLLDPVLHKHVRLWCSKRRDVQLTLELSCGGVEVPIEEGWLEIPLEKLINNALKAMPGPGKLTVRSIRSGNQVEVQVEDTGKGVPENIRKMLFKRPVPQPSAQEGSGLGLLIARKVLTAHDGELFLLRSAPGQGTTFVFRLPVTAAVGGEAG